MSEEEPKRQRKLDETDCGNGQDNENNDDDNSDEKIKIVMNNIINKIELKEKEDGELEEGECL